MSRSEAPQVVWERRGALGAAALVCVALPAVLLLVGDARNDDRTAALGWFVGAFLAGAGLTLVYWSPYRALGFVLPAAGLWLAAAGHGVYWHEWPGWASGLPLGLAIGACARGRRGGPLGGELPVLGAAVLLGGGISFLLVNRGRPFDAAEWLVLASAVALVGWAALRFFRPTFELALEPLFWLGYRVRATGPGLAAFPHTGPCLVIANHACWVDPLFLVKVLPRPLTPMMTSGFYDLPVLKWLMVRFGIIRVPDRALKKDAPEVLEAVAALDRGECVVIFPEGYLRRSDDKPLRRFGQGVWKILKERPETPVVAIWIEGGWGSYTSHCNGVPTKNKRPDVRRPIVMGVCEAVAVPPDVLADHMPTRIYLMNLVSAARSHAGLEPLPSFTIPAKGEEEEKGSEGEVVKG